MLHTGLLHRSPDDAKVCTPESPCPLKILCSSDAGYQGGNQRKQDPTASNMHVQGVPGSQDLHDKGEEMVPPQPVVLEGVGGDVIRAGKVQQQERCPEGDQPVLAHSASQGQGAEGIRRRAVRQLVCQPEKQPLCAAALTPPDP
jgi:hypothetical protein